MTDTPTNKPFDEHSYLIWMHASQLAFFVGIPSFVIPLIMWIIKKDQYPAINTHGKDILNFQITLVIACVVSFFLCFILIGFPLLFALIIVQLVIPIIAANKVNKNEPYRYPFTIQFLK
ncbi:MAG: DUF4870 domain-containing protein [Candidatus Roizmanbacteria bacterium]